MRWWRKTWCASAWLGVLLISAEGCGPTEGMRQPSKTARARRRILEMPVEESLDLPEAELLEEPALPGTLRPRGFTRASPEGVEAEAPLAEGEPAPDLEAEAAAPGVEGEAEPPAAAEAEEPVAEEEPAAGDRTLE